MFLEPVVIIFCGLESRIEAQLLTKLGFVISVYARTILELQECIQTASYRGETAYMCTRQTGMFLSNPLSTVLVTPHISPTGEFEVMAVVQDIAFVRLQLRNGNSGIVAGYIDKLLGVRTT